MPSFIFYHSKDEASQKRKWHEENILAHQRDENRSWKKGLQKGELVVNACEDPDSQSDEDDPNFTAGMDLEEDPPPWLVNSRHSQPELHATSWTRPSRGRSASAFPSSTYPRNMHVVFS